jgi:hypothetical protein
MEIHDLRRRADLHRTDIQRVVHLILCLDLAALTVFFRFSQDGLGILLVLGLEQILEVLRGEVDLLVRAFSCGGEVVCRRQWISMEREEGGGCEEARTHIFSRGSHNSSSPPSPHQGFAAH